MPQELSNVHSSRAQKLWITDCDRFWNNLSGHPQKKKTQNTRTHTQTSTHVCGLVGKCVVIVAGLKNCVTLLAQTNLGSQTQEKTSFYLQKRLRIAHLNFRGSEERKNLGFWVVFLAFSQEKQRRSGVTPTHFPGGANIHSSFFRIAFRCMLLWYWVHKKSRIAVR